MPFGLGVTKVLPIPVFALVNAEATAYVAALSPAPGKGLQQVIDAAITFWKTGGDATWTITDEAHILGLGLANIKSPGTLDATSTGTLVAGQYIATDGVSTKITLMNPTVGTPNYVQNSAHFSVRRINCEIGAVRESGWFDGTDGTGTNPRSVTNQSAYRINQATAASSANNTNIDATKLLCATRTASNNTKQYLNGVVQTDTSAANQTSTALNANTFFLGQGDASSFFAGDYVSVFIGSGLTAAQALNQSTGENMITSAMGLDLNFAPSVIKVSADFAINLPDAIGGATGEGFTGTGMAKIPGEDAFLCMSYGGSTEADVTFEPAFVKVTYTGTKVYDVSLLTAFPTMTTGQGLDIHPDRTVWFVSQAEGRIYHATQLGGFLVGGFTAAGCNGLCIDTKRNKIVLTFDVAGTIVRYNFDGTGAETVYSGLNNVDQISYCAAKDWYIVTSGANGAVGVINAIDASVKKFRRAWNANPSTSIEGCYFDPNTRILRTLNDGFFHQTGNLKNQMQGYQL